MSVQDEKKCITLIGEIEKTRPLIPYANPEFANLTFIRKYTVIQAKIKDLKFKMEGPKNQLSSIWDEISGLNETIEALSKQIKDLVDVFTLFSLLFSVFCFNNYSGEKTQTAADANGFSS
jgi:hypothetical protein